MLKYLDIKPADWYLLASSNKISEYSHVRVVSDSVFFFFNVY